MTSFMMRGICRTVTLWVALLLSAGAMSTESVDQWVSAANRAIALGADQQVFMSYHPGRVSILAMLEEDGAQVTGLYALNQRGRFLVHPVDVDRLWVAFVPEDGCAGDARLVSLSLPTARRAHDGQFRGTRGVRRSGTVDLSQHAVVNRELPLVLEGWGELERRRWAGATTVALPTDGCPLRWVAGRLELTTRQGRVLFDPDSPDRAEAGAGWLFDAHGQARAKLEGDGTLRIDGASWPGFEPPARLLGLTPGGDILLQIDPDGAVYRWRDGGWELFLDPDRHPFERVLRRPGTDQVISLDGHGERRLYLDHRWREVLRGLERDTGRGLDLIDTLDDRLLLGAERSFWLATGGRIHPLESRRPWLDGTDATAPFAVIQGLDGSESERSGLTALGVATRGDLAIVCTARRRWEAGQTLTELDCPHGQRSWRVRLATESDHARAGRLREMAEFMAGRSSEP